MVGKNRRWPRSRASALLLVGGQAAFAADDGLPYEKLVEVVVPTRRTSTRSSSSYDAAEYKRVEADGSIILNVFVTSEEEKARSRPPATRSARTIEDSNTGSSAWRSARRSSTRRRSPPTSPRTAAQGHRSSRASPSSRRRATRSSSARTPSRTSSARRAPRTTARFLYVEAFNKSTKVTGTSTVTGPTLALSYAGADGVYSDGQQHGPLRRHRSDAGRLHVPPAADPPARRRSRDDHERSASPPRRPPAARPPASRPSRSPSGSARTSRRTSRASRTRRSSRTTWTRPRTARTSTRSPRPVPGADVGRQHAGEDLGLPAQVAGDHVRLERHRHGSGRADRRRRCSTPRARSRPPRRSGSRSRSPSPRVRPCWRPSTASRPARPTSS